MNIPRALAAALLLTVAWCGLAEADCTRPTAVEGTFIYNDTVNAMQVCNGADWLNTGMTSPTAPGGTCSSPSGNEGQVFYNVSTHTVQFCNGANWVNTACPTEWDGGSGCSSPTGAEGVMIYNASVKRPQFCEGDAWVNMGTVCSGSGSLGVGSVFSADLYTGNNTTNTITNGIDLSGSGGLVWFKIRNNGFNNRLIHVPPLPSGDNALSSNLMDADMNAAAFVSANADGFTLGSDGTSGINLLASTVVAWTFRKAPKFFDMVTYTGNQTNRLIAHNLGVEPGMIVVKSFDTSSDWAVYHRSIPNSDYLTLNGANPKVTESDVWNSTAASSTHFSLGKDQSRVNKNGKQYVAYLFAHDPSGNIQCGSYAGNGSTTGPIVNLGWQPQFLMLKNATGTGNWLMLDTARGIATPGSDAHLLANASNNEASAEYLNLTSDGFQLSSNNSAVNSSGATYVYCAIKAQAPIHIPSWYSGITYLADGGSNYGACTQPTEALMNDENTGPKYTWLSAAGTNGELQADLGSAKSVSVIGLGGKGPSSCFSDCAPLFNEAGTELQHSNDGSSWTSLGTLSSLAPSFTYATAIQTVTFAPVTARYWRLYSASGYACTGQFRLGG